jgi:hypothetical protein
MHASAMHGAAGMRGTARWQQRCACDSRITWSCVIFAQVNLDRISAQIRLFLNG